MMEESTPERRAAWVRSAGYQLIAAITDRGADLLIRARAKDLEMALEATESESALSGSVGGLNAAEEVTTFTPLLWVSMSEEQRYEEYVRVRKLLSGGLNAAPPDQPVRDMGETTIYGDRICETCGQQVPRLHRCVSASPVCAAEKKALEEKI